VAGQRQRRGEHLLRSDPKRLQTHDEAEPQAAFASALQQSGVKGYPGSLPTRTRESQPSKSINKEREHVGGRPTDHRFEDRSGLLTVPVAVLQQSLQRPGRQTDHLRFVIK